MSAINQKEPPSLKALTEDQVTFFIENGYLNNVSILSDDQLTTLRREYDEVIEKGAQLGYLENLAAGGDNKSDEKQMLQLQSPSSANIYFHRLLYHEPLLDVVEDLIGPNIQLFHDQILYKPPRHGSEVYLHRDNTYWKCHPATVVTCWLTLDDAGADNGTMYVIPRSHVTNTSTGDEGDISDAVICEVSAGSALFHHCEMLHYSTPNASEKPRRALGLHYVTPGTRSPLVNVRVSLTHPILRMRV